MKIVFNLQPTLENDIVKLVPLKKQDFEALYSVASDPLIWEQHPNKERHKREVFQNFFNGALEHGALLIYDNQLNKLIGSTRFYDLDQENKSIVIGYTFFAREYWGGTYNQSVKKLMIDYAFQHLEQVLFHIGAQNIRSQKAIAKLGAIKIDEQHVAYYGEPEKLNFIYSITNVR
jgi:RimJ/RimL family protein N-acetyltransferase